MVAQYRGVPGGAAAVAVGGGAQPAQRSASAATRELNVNARFLEPEDYGISETPSLGDPEAQQLVLAEVEGMVGMVEAKAFFKQIGEMVQYIESGGSMKLLRTSLSMIITGWH